MNKIRAYADWDDRTKTHYYKDFEIVEELPKVDEIYYEDSSSKEVVKSVESVRLDCENNDNVYNYDFYKIIVSCYDKDRDEVEDNEYYICIEKNTEDDEYYN